MTMAFAVLAFHQVYRPVGDNIVFSALIAGIPLYILFVMLAVLRLPAWLSALTAMLSGAVVAFLVWGMPGHLVISSTTEGMAFGLWPIIWIVLNAVFFHSLTIASGDFDVIRRSLTRLTEDRRVQALIVAFCFGALMEGVAGFGAPVAISAAVLASLGFEPITAAVLALLANTAPVAFGSIGIPVVTLGLLTTGIIGHGPQDQTHVTLLLSAMVGRQLPLFSVIIPGFLIVVLAGWKRMVQVLPAVITAGVSFAVVQFAVSNFVGPELTDILAALVSMGAVAVLLRFWRPVEIWGFDHDAPAVATAGGGSARPRSLGAAVAQTVDSPARIAQAYLMYVILVVVILIGQMGNLPFFAGNPPGNPKNALPTPWNITADLKCGAPAFKLCPKPWIGPTVTEDAQAFKFPYWSFQWPGSWTGTSKKPKPEIFREPPVVKKSTAYPLTFNWDFLAAAGSLVLYACVIAYWVMRARGLPVRFWATYGSTVRRLALPIVTIACILGIAQVMNYSGMTGTLAVLMAKTGVLFPFFSAFIGWLGVFLTGSDTSSNTLFGPMQALTAKLSTHHLSPVLTAGTNSSGGVMGKMISPQNLSVGAAGVDKVGAEGEIFRRTVGYSLILTAAVGIIAFIEAYVIPGIIPS